MAIDDNTSYELTGYQVKDLAQKIRAKADSNSLASVATSGLYSDLTGAPTIPTVYNGTLTIQQNGTQLGTFSANQSSNTTINITGGGSSPITTFYGTFNTAYHPESGLGSHLYSDNSLTTMVTSQDVYDATTSGTVAIEIYDANYPYTIVITSTRVWEEDLTVGYEFGCESIANGYGDGPFIYVLSASAASTTFSETHRELQIKLTAGTNISINQTTNTISATDTTYSNFTGATSSVAGAAGLVPAPAAGDEGKALHGDGTWKDTTAKLVEMSYGESNAWTKFINAYNAGSIVYCRASSNANPATGSQTRKAFMAYVNNATSPTSVEFQYVRSASSKTDSQQTDQVFVYTLTNASGGTWSVASRNMGPKIVAGTGMSSTFTTGANATITLNAEPNYSASEVDTKVKWVDNKTIYRKTFTFSSGDGTIAHGISDLGTVVKIDAVFNDHDFDDALVSSLPIPSQGTDWSSHVIVNATNVVVTLSGSWNVQRPVSYVTLYYTKSS